MIQVARMDSHLTTSLEYDNDLFELPGEYEDVLHGHKRKKKSVELLSPVEKGYMRNYQVEDAGIGDCFDWQCGNDTASRPWLDGESGLGSPSEDVDYLLSSELFPSVKTPEAQLEDFTDQVDGANGKNNAILQEVSMAASPNELTKPCRIRKKSQTLAWYQSSRKRKVSYSACSPSRARTSSMSEVARLRSETELLASAGGSSEPHEHASGNVDFLTLKSGMEDFVTLPVDSNVNHKDGPSELDAGEHYTMEIELSGMLPEGYAIQDIDRLLWSLDNDNDGLSELLDVDDEGAAGTSRKARKFDQDSEPLGANIFSDDIFDSLNVDQESASCMSDEHKSRVLFGHSFCDFDSDKGLDCKPPNFCGAFPEPCKSATSCNQYPEADSTHRRPGRPRKKSISQSVAWYRSHRKRQASLSSASNTSFSHESFDSNQRRLSARIARRSTDGHRSAAGPRNAKRSYGRKPRTAARKKWFQVTPTDVHKRYMWEHSSNDSGYEVDYTSTTTVSCESDDDDAIVDVVTVSTSVNERPNDAFSPANLKAMVGLVNAWHCYCSPMSLATQRALAKASSRETKFKLVLSPERRSSMSSTVDCAVPTSRSLSTSRKNRNRRREARDRVTDEQRIKREALNDLERNRRREMTRELTALRVVVPSVRDNPRAPKVTILDSAAHHIRFLERLLARNEALLAEQHQKMADLKALCC